MLLPRLPVPLLLAGGIVAGALGAGTGCERRAQGVDFSVDRDFDFGALRRVAIVDPPDAGKAAGLDRVLVDAASDALGERFMVVYGNRLRVAVRSAGMDETYRQIREQLLAGRDPDGDTLKKFARAIGVDGLWVTDLASFERRHHPDYSYATVMSQNVATGSGYATVHQTNSTATITTVRLTARLFDADSGLTVWSGSKFYETTLNLESTGLKPIFRTVSEDFVLTLPAPRSASAQPERPGEAERMRTSR